MFVATTSRRTVAGRVTRKWTITTSRKPSRFGLTVVSKRRSPAKGAEPFVTRRSASCGAAPARAAATRKAVTRPSCRLQFPYFPLIQGTIAASILVFDEAIPHLCRARSAGAARCVGRAPARCERRHAIRPRRARHDHDPGPRRGDRQLRTGQGDDQRSGRRRRDGPRSEEHTSELQSRENLVCRLLLEKKQQHLVTLLVDND